MDSVSQYNANYIVGNNGTFFGNFDCLHYLNEVKAILTGHECQKWIYSVIGCILVGLSGIFPVFLFSNSRVPTGSVLNIGQENLKCLLSFAVGSLLGDVFLHLLPEAWSNAIVAGCSGDEALKSLGFWILAGITSFLICEIIASYQCELDEVIASTHPTNNLVLQEALTKTKSTAASSQKQIAGYLNLVANGFDNFTHGLAVAGSFIISPKIGVLTTAAILVHEIPHEIGDFAILLRSGFNPWSAAKAQISTATIGLIGAIFTLSVDCMKTIGNYTDWILPFTAGCFIHIALSNLLPDLLKEENPKESMKQFLCLVLGIGTMGCVMLFIEP